MPTHTFHDIKCGDLVWLHFEAGNVVQQLPVTDVHPSSFCVGQYGWFKKTDGTQAPLSGCVKVYRTAPSVVCFPEQPKPKRKVVVRGWVNIYRDSDGTISMGMKIYPTPAKASANVGTGRLACIHIWKEVTEGEGIENC